LQMLVLLYSPVGEYNSFNTSNLTNQLVGFVTFTCAKILNIYSIQTRRNKAMLIVNDI
jgi:hypothetical protein